MWAIRILSGAQAGHFFPLKSGPNVLGRSPSCDIKILSPNVSKEHAKIEVYDDKIIVSDMGSRNGTFVNGTQLRSHKVKPGDRFGLHDVILEIIPLAAAQQMRQALAAAPPAAYGNVAYQMPSPQMAPPPAQGHNPQPEALGIADMAREYMDRVVMPGIYRLAEMMEFKVLLGLFMAGFVLLVTSLSTIPLIRILRDSVEQQSQQHALTIAATLARVNEAAVRDGLFTAINMSTAQRSGVAEALIITKVDGKIIAPAARAESYPDIPFIHEARNHDSEAVQQVDSSTVVALYPIVAYNPETGARGTLAFAVIKYDMATLAVDDSKTISLFVITLFIATILGFALFYFLYRLIEYPLNSLNLQLDTALREGRDDLKTNFIFEPLTRLTSNINSALSRAISGTGQSAAPRQMEHDRRLEMSNLAEMIGFAAMIVNAFDRNVVAVNQGFEQRTRLDPTHLISQPVSNISDQALKLSLLDLMDRLEQNPDQLANNDIEFGGNGFQLIAQAIYGSAKVAYYVVILVPAGGDA
ncbi:MAG: FHA domain-containing protein [Bdellovibrionales bacterium]